MTAPAITTDAVTIHLGNCLDILREMPDASVDSIVTDPPYGLSNTDPAHVVEALTKWATGERDFVPTGRGFMGKSWDAFVPPPAVWDECFRVLKPGGHLLAFAGSRTFDLMTLSIRFAGFDIRDGIAWLYGSGFPKSLDVSKAIDKAGGNPLAFREFARAYAAAVAGSTLNHADIDRHLGIKSSSCYWAREDHRGGMPPRHHWEAARDLLGLDESFSKLYDEAERAVIGQKTSGIGTAFGDGEWASGPAQVVDITAPATPAAQQWQGWGTALKPAFEPIVVARKPLIGTVAANVLAHGTGALNIDGCRVGAPEDKRAAGTRSYSRHDTGSPSKGVQAAPHDGLGRWPANVVMDGDTADALDEQTGVLTSGKMPAGTQKRGKEVGIYGKFEPQPSLNDTIGDSGGASRFFPTFRYQAKAPTRERPVVVAEDGTKTAHPTVKPLALMRWLVRLVTPPGGVVLDPFVGSGTTMEAAALEGFHALGIEREADYLPLIQQRLDRVAD